MAEDLQECEQEWVALRMQAPGFGSQAFLAPHHPTNSSSRQPNMFALVGAVCARSRFGLERIKYQKTFEALGGAGSWEEGEQAARLA